MEESFLEIFNQYARSELFVLVPVLYAIGRIFVASKVKNERIPLVITVISIVLCLAYTFSTVPVISFATVLLALFTSVTQGILFAGASFLGGIFLSRKLPNKNKSDSNNLPKEQ